jgi:hypothetical protein
VLLKIWDVTLRGQAVQIILGLHDPADKDMTLRGHAVQIILGLHDPADRDHDPSKRSGTTHPTTRCHFPREWKLQFALCVYKGSDVSLVVSK